MRALLLAGLLDLLAPRWCEGCGVSLRGNGRGPAGEGEPPDGFLCGGCRSLIRPVPPPHCTVCYRTSGALVCPECLKRRHRFAACVAGGLYEGLLAELIHGLKYRGKAHLAVEMARLIAAEAAGRRQVRLVDALVYVPMTRRAERERGYNHAALVAGELAALWRVPVCHALVKTRETGSQVGLPGAERRRNVRGAFAPARGVDLGGARVGLVDDVMTTGATADECAKALAAAGAAAVVVLVAARDQ